MPLKVIFLMEDLCFGGTQRQMLALASRLDRNLFSPSMLMLTGKTDLDDVAKDSLINTIYLGSSRKVPFTFFLSLRKKILENKPDILILCTALPNIWGRIWGKILKIPVVIGTCRGGGAIFRQHEKYLWRMADHIICNSNALYNELHKIGVEKKCLTYIPNGVDINYYKCSTIVPSKKKPLLVCVARLAKDKDHLTLLKAFKIILNSHKEVRLRIVGDGPEKFTIEKYIKEFNLENDVELIPGDVDVRMHYEEAKIFVLSSIREGQPNVLLEAMSCGLPICATNVGGIPQIVDDFQNGLLSNPMDCEKLAQNIAYLLENPDKLDFFGKNGRIKVENTFSFDTMVKEHQNVFQMCFDVYNNKR